MRRPEPAESLWKPAAPDYRRLALGLPGSLKYELPSSADLVRSYRGEGRIRWHVSTFRRADYWVLINRLVEPAIMRLSYDNGSFILVELPSHDREMG